MHHLWGQSVANGKKRQLFGAIWPLAAAAILTTNILFTVPDALARARIANEPSFWRHWRAHSIDLPNDRLDRLPDDTRTGTVSECTIKAQWLPIEGDMAALSCPFNCHPLSKLKLCHFTARVWILILWMPLWALRNYDATVTGPSGNGTMRHSLLPGSTHIPFQLEVISMIMDTII